MKKKYIILFLACIFLILQSINFAVYYFSVNSISNEIAENSIESSANILYNELRQAIELGLSLEEIDDLNDFCEKYCMLFSRYFNEIYIVDNEGMIIAHNNYKIMESSKKSIFQKDDLNKIIKKSVQVFRYINHKKNYFIIYSLNIENPFFDSENKDTVVLNNLFSKKKYYLIINKFIKQETGKKLQILAAFMILSTSIFFSAIIIIINRYNKILLKPYRQINEQLQDIITLKNYKTRVITISRAKDVIAISSTINNLLLILEELEKQILFFSEPDAKRFKIQAEGLNTKLLEFKISAEHQKKEINEINKTLNYEIVKTSELLSDILLHLKYPINNQTPEEEKRLLELLSNIMYRSSQLYCCSSILNNSAVIMEHSNILEIINNTLDEFDLIFKERGIILDLQANQNENYSLYFPKKLFETFLSAYMRICLYSLFVKKFFICISIEIEEKINTNFSIKIPVRFFKISISSVVGEKSAAILNKKNMTIEDETCL